MREIMSKYPRIIDNSKGRSIADPWVIAHAEQENATVVTLEQKAQKPGQVTIPMCVPKKALNASTSTT